MIYQNNKHASDTITVLKKLKKNKNMNKKMREMKITAFFLSSGNSEALGK